MAGACASGPESSPVRCTVLTRALRMICPQHVDPEAHREKAAATYEPARWGTLVTNSLHWTVKRESLASNSGIER